MNPTPLLHHSQHVDDKSLHKDRNWSRRSRIERESPFINHVSGIPLFSLLTINLCLFISDWVEVLSSDRYTEDSLDGVTELVESIRLQGMEGITESSRAIRKKLKYGNVHRQIRALTVSQISLAFWRGQKLFQARDRGGETHPHPFLSGNSFFEHFPKTEVRIIKPISQIHNSSSDSKRWLRM